jgi:hypothetical protein
LIAKFFAWFRSFSTFSDVYGACESVTWGEKVAEANRLAVHDERATCRSAVGRPILLALLIFAYTATLSGQNVFGEVKNFGGVS